MDTVKKKIPMRTCVVTKQVLPKRDLIRVVLNKEGNVSVDLTGKAHGRGAYVSSELSNVSQDKVISALKKKLNIDIPNDIYNEIIRSIKDNN